MHIFTVDESAAAEAMRSHGYDIKSIQIIPGGSNHYVFSVQLADGRKVISKFVKVRNTEAGLFEPGKDTLFGSPYLWKGKVI